MVEVVEYKGKGGVLAYLQSDEAEDRVYDPIQQAEEVARLAEVAKEIEKAVKAYYAKKSKYDDYGNPIPVFPKGMCKQ